MEPLSEFYAAVGDWALRNGHVDIKSRVKPGDLYPMKDDVRDGIVVQANPSNAPVRGCPPWHFIIERDGLPLAVIGPRGGEGLAGAEDWLINRFKRVRTPSEDA